MQELKDLKNNIHKCSKCGLCQAVCPIYQETGNDCTVSRGLFIMLKGFINGDLKMTKNINHYLNICLKCGACTKFCPSGIDVVDIISAAKYEYYKTHKLEQILSFLQKSIIFGLIPNLISILKPRTKSKIFDKKVLYFGGCGSKLKGDKSIVKLLNKLNIEVINPNFSCCGIPLFTRGDFDGFENCINNYIKILKKYDIKEVITTCASCEKALKDYIKHTDKQETKDFLNQITVKNIYEYLNEEKFSLKKNIKVTYHKPCNINNYEKVEQILETTENLEFVKMKDFDKCCGLNGLTKISNYSIFKNIFKEKRKNIIDSNADIVLTSCLGCETALKLYSFGKYKTMDFVDFLSENIEK